MNPIDRASFVAAFPSPTIISANTTTARSEGESHFNEDSSINESSDSKQESQSHVSSIFATNMIQLHVGPEQKVYTAHKAVLTRIPFFHKCLNENFVEGSTNIVKLPEEVATAVEYVLHYAYHNSLPDGGIVKSPSTMVQAYILADKWCIEDLENKLIDRFHSHFQKKWVEPQHISMLSQYGLADSHLRRLMLQDLGHFLYEWDFNTQSKNKWDVNMLEFCRKGGEDVVDLLRSCA